MSDFVPISFADNLGETKLNQIVSPEAKQAIIEKQRAMVEEYLAQEEKRIEPLKEQYNENLKRFTAVDPSLLDQVWFLITKAPKLIGALYKLINIITEFKMNPDKKTTLTGTITAVIGIIVAIVNIFGIQIPQEMVDTLIGVAVGIVGIVQFIQGYFTNKK